MDVTNKLILVAFFFVVIGNSADALCLDGVAPEATLTLRKRLFCDYDRNIQPVEEHTKRTDVSLILLPKFLVFFDFYDTLQVHSWMVLQWTDETLTWNKTEFEDIDKLTVPSGTIWLPDLDIDELSDNELMSHRVDNMPCSLTSTGLITCLVAATHSALCDADARSWPFDQHTCTLTVQSWSKAESINLNISGVGISTRLYKQSRDWEMLKMSVEREVYNDDMDVPVSKLTFSLILRRFAGEGASGVVVPAIVLASLTWLTFLLESRSAERLTVICVNIFCHCSYLLHICFRIPPNGDSIPLILLFYRDSLLMAASSLIITILVRKMDASASQPPAWVAGIVNGVLATLPGQMLLLNGVDPKDVAAVVDAENAERSGPNRWRLFGALVDYLSLATCVLANFVLLIKCFL